MLAAIETTGAVCGVALFEGEELRSELHVEIGRAHDRLLGRMMREALEVAGASPRDLGAIGVSIGPGSYTGIRIGISFAVGLSLAVGADLIPVPTLEAVAYGVRDLGVVGHRSRVISLVSAGRSGLYAQLFEIVPEFRTLTEARVIPLEQVPPLLDENVFAAGPGTTLLDESCNDCIAINSSTLTARDIGLHALYLRRHGTMVSPEEIQPLYISGEQWTKTKE